MSAAQLADSHRGRRTSRDAARSLHSARGVMRKYTENSHSQFEQFERPRLKQLRRSACRNERLSSRTRSIEHRAKETCDLFQPAL